MGPNFAISVQDKIMHVNFGLGLAKFCKSILVWDQPNFACQFWSIIIIDGPKFDG